MVPIAEYTEVGAAGSGNGDDSVAEAEKSAGAAAVLAASAEPGSELGSFGSWPKARASSCAVMLPPSSS